jgi:hypothetical protein
MDLIFAFIAAATSLVWWIVALVVALVISFGWFAYMAETAPIEDADYDRR